VSKAVGTSASVLNAGLVGLALLRVYTFNIVPLPLQSLQASILATKSYHCKRPEDQ